MIETPRFEDHRGWIERRVAYFCRTRPVSYDDARSDAYLGFVLACRRYDGRVGFRTYAEAVIRGAMLDGMRSRDFLSRTARCRATREGRRNGSMLVSEEILFSVPVAGQQDSQVYREEASRLVHAALDRLMPKEQLVMRLVYSDDRTMAEIAPILGVNESRISQIHSNASAKLAKHLAAVLGKRIASDRRPRRKAA